MASVRTLRAEVADAIASALAILHPADAAGQPIWEIRAPKTGRRGTVSGYFDDAELCAQHVAAQLDGQAPAVYVTLNPIKRELLARAMNRLQDRADNTTADADVTRRLWLPLDFDPVREAGISASDAEHAAALARAAEVAAFLADLGWAEPISADSGNGGHLLNRIDLPNDEASRQLVERVLQALAYAFDDTTDPDAPQVRLDTSVGNAGRIWKVYGTLACKGDNAPDLGRPHRRSRVLSVPARLDVVTREQLVDLCELVGAPASTTATHNAHNGHSGPSQGSHGAGWVDDAGDYLHEHGIEVVSERPGATFHRWVLRSCVWNPDHTDHSAYVLQFTGTGAIVAGCSHKSCQGNHWPEFRDAVEPGWRVKYKPGTNGRYPHPEPLAESEGTNEKNENNEENTRDGPGEGFSSFSSFISYARRDSDEGADQGGDDYPKLDSAAFYGVAGDIVSAIEPHTEAAPVALLTQLLVCAGNAAGRYVYYRQEADYHYANLYATLVGDSAKARKGVSWGHVNRVMRDADPTWAAKHVIGGLSSGEGIIHALRNVAGDQIPDGDEGELLRDKRLLAREGEFASVLAQKARDGNILSAVLRDAWDGVTLGSLTKNSPERASDTYLSVIGHITQAELVKHMTATDLLNGYANRFLFVATRRARLLAHGGDLDAITRATAEPIDRLREALMWARTPRHIAHDKPAYDLWEAEYKRLTTGHPGLFGAVTSRAEAHVTRLALVYAILDCSKFVTVEHLQAALALWQYCEDSARYIFGDLIGDTVADRVLAALRAAPDGLTRTEISELFDRNSAKARIDTALAELERARLAYRVKETTGERGRPVERWKAYTDTKETKKTN
jgi:hypothetical protein